MNPIDWIQYELLGNTLLLWGSALAVFIVVWLALLLARRMLRGRLKWLAKHKEAAAFEISEHIVSATREWFLLVTALFVGSRVLVVEPALDTIVVRIATTVLLLQGGLWAAAGFLSALHARREREVEENPGAVAAMDLLSFAARVVIWSIVLLLILDNVGVNVTALIAGLGVGGIAVALAAQNILGDLFASLSIVLDKPFVVGDFLIVGEHLGSVERVGIKTTRVRSLSGEQLVFSNNDLLNSRIRNYGRMVERRIVFSLGVTYQTPVDKLERIPGMIRETIESQEDVRFDRAHFQKYGDFALIFEVVYYVQSPDYNRYMDIQQAVNLGIYRQFDEADIEFAYPTQTLYVRKLAEPSAATETA